MLLALTFLYCGLCLVKKKNTPPPQNQKASIVYRSIQCTNEILLTNLFNLRLKNVILLVFIDLHFYHNNNKIFKNLFDTLESESDGSNRTVMQPMKINQKNSPANAMPVESLFSLPSWDSDS